MNNLLKHTDTQYVIISSCIYNLLSYFLNTYNGCTKKEKGV